jgi:hypothetical protein
VVSCARVINEKLKKNESNTSFFMENGFAKCNGGRLERC